MKAILILIALYGFAKASLLEDALLFKHCLTYGSVDTINVVTEKPRAVTKRLILHYGGGNAIQVSSPFWMVTLDTAKLLVVIPAWLDSAGVKTYPPGAFIQSEDSAGVNYGATYYCLERPTTAVRRGPATRRAGQLSPRTDALGRTLTDEEAKSKSHPLPEPKGTRPWH